jgi:uncharacterized membrane protein YeiH
MVGHTGDCRIVLSEKGGIARDLTIDHKPINASEKEVWTFIHIYIYASFIYMYTFISIHYKLSHIGFKTL